MRYTVEIEIPKRPLNCFRTKDLFGLEKIINTFGAFPFDYRVRIKRESAYLIATPDVDRLFLLSAALSIPVYRIFCDLILRLT